MSERLSTLPSELISKSASLLGSFALAIAKKALEFGKPPAFDKDQSAVGDTSFIDKSERVIDMEKFIEEGQKTVVVPLYNANNDKVVAHKERDMLILFDTSDAACIVVPEYINQHGKTEPDKKVFLTENLVEQMLQMEFTRVIDHSPPPDLDIEYHRWRESLTQPDDLAA